MLISHSHRFVFLKTHKTAGTSLHAMLRPFCVPPNDRTEATRALHISPWGMVSSATRTTSEQYSPHNWYEHSGLEVLRTYMPIAFHTYHKIAVVRHPYDKVVSAFLYDKWNYEQSHKRDMLQPGEPGDMPENFHRYVTASELSWSMRHDRELFFAGGKFRIESIIRFESLQKDLQKMSNRLGLGLDIAKALPLKKRVVEEELRQRYRQLITPATKAVIDEYYGWYFDQFGYEKTL